MKHGKKHGGVGDGGHGHWSPFAEPSRACSVCVGGRCVGGCEFKPGFSPGLYTGIPSLSPLLPFLWESLGRDGDIILDGDLQEPRELYLYAGSEKYQFGAHGSLVTISRYSVR